MVTVNSRIFRVAADADAGRDLGGFTVEVMMNGDGSARKKKTRKPWRLTGLTLEIDNTNGDLEFLQDVADGEGWVPISITMVDGFTYGGQGTVADDLEASTDNATADVTLSGPAKLEVQ